MAEDRAALDAKIAKDISDRLATQHTPVNQPAVDAETQAIAVTKQRALDYRICFGSEAGQRVLSDIREFCFACQDTFAIEAAVAAHNNGRRRVLLRIEAFMGMNDARIEAIVRAQIEQQRQ